MATQIPTHELRPGPWTPHGVLAGALAPAAPLGSAPAAPSADLFDRTAWLYAFLREHLFRDDTARIAEALWPDAAPAQGTTLLEVGCGPGLYARRLAQTYPRLQTIGVDRSARLVELARSRARAAGLDRCHFEVGDARSLDVPSASLDAAVAARLLTVVDGPALLAELYRVLRPGGRCFLAEPASWLGATLPLLSLRFAIALAGPATIAESGPADAASPRAVTRLTAADLADLAGTQPWAAVRVWSQDGYHYAVCQKATGAAAGIAPDRGVSAPQAGDAPTPQPPRPAWGAGVGPRPVAR